VSVPAAGHHHHRVDGAFGVLQGDDDRGEVLHVAGVKVGYVAAGEHLLAAA
jgi:hypothetical protein